MSEDKTNQNNNITLPIHEKLTGMVRQQNQFVDKLTQLQKKLVDKEHAITNTQTQLVAVEEEKRQLHQQVTLLKDEIETLKNQQALEKVTQEKVIQEKTVELADQLEKTIKLVEISKTQEARIHDLQQKFESLTLTNERLLEKQKAAEVLIRTRGTDADIDGFISDITPYFYGRSVTYVDVGACYGDVFLKLYNTKNIKMREAHLYEPNPDSFAKLSENIKGLSTTSLHSYNIGLADKEKVLKMSKAGSMSKVVSHRVDNDSVTEILEVNCFELDELSNAITDRRIDLLKIDVEGSEIEVLAGAKRLLKDQRVDVIYIEVGFNINGTQQVYFGKVDSLLQKYHYRCFKIYEQKNEWVQDSPLLRRCNFAYMSESFAKANPFNLSNELLNLREQIKAKSNT